MKSIRNRIAATIRESIARPQNHIRHVQSSTLLHQHIDTGDITSIQEINHQIAGSLNNSIDTVTRLQDLVVAIDITYPTEQISAYFAEQLARSILSMLDQNYPALRDRFVGISVGSKKLPLRDLMLTGKLALEEIDNQHIFVFE